MGGYGCALPTGQDVDFFLRVSLEGSWLHVPGEPVHFYVGFTAAEGEEGDLSTKYRRPPGARWVRVRERFITLRNDEAHLAPSDYEPLLAKLWHKTGCAYREQGRHERAVACCRKALEYQPTKLKSWLRFVMEGSRLAGLRRFRVSRPNAGRLES